MSIYTLYVKTHNKTGLKYLGKTKTSDPHKYQGSGLEWKNHIKQYGYDVTTTILHECKTNKELSEWGRYYSKLWNVVESDEWANLIPETGGGDYAGFSEKRLIAVSKALKGVPKSDKHKENLRGKRGKHKLPKSGKNMARTIGDSQKDAISQALKDVPKSDEQKLKISESLKITCSCTICQNTLRAYQLNSHYKKHH